MSLGSAIARFSPRQWTRRAIPWIGGLFIGAIVALAAYDIVRGYRTTVEETGRELDTQARIISEQTARSLQAVDVLLRHLTEQFRIGTLSALSSQDLRAYLQEQAVGLVQIDGLLILHADGSVRGSSYLRPGQEAAVDVSRTATFQAMRSDRNLGLFIDAARRSEVDQQWVFPIARRLESSSGQFAGVVSARGRIDYFQKFYRDIRLDQGTKATLMHHNGTLVARYPVVESALGKRFPLFDEMLASHATREPGPTRTISPVDDVERFGAIQLVPDYPLAVIVTRDVAVALAPWRAQAIGSAIRTLALAALAAVLLAIGMRQLARLAAVRRSLEASQERFALAVAGSDDGIWDFDFAARRVFISARAREISGMPRGPEMQPMDEWFAMIEQSLHPDDAPRRRAAMKAHLAGEAPAYEVEFRHRHPDGVYRWVHVRGLCIRDASGKPLRMAGSVSDIDARKRAEEALRLSEERFALAVAGSNDGIVDWDIANDRMFTSQRAMQIAGIDSDITIRTRAEWVALLQLHPDDVRRHADDFRRHLEGETEVREGEYRLRHRDGKYRWVRVRGTSVRDASGCAIRWAGSVSDIDAQKRTEEALRKSEERYQLAAAGSDDGVWDWDYETGRAFGSARAREILSLPPGPEEQSIDEWFASIELQLHPEDAPKRIAAIEAHLSGKTPAYEGEFRVRNPDGSYRWVRIRGLCVRKGSEKPHRMAGSISDIDRQKTAEQALRQSEARYQLAVDGANQGLWDWDLSTDTLFLSARAQEFMGLAPSEPLRPRREWIARSSFHPDDVEVARSAVSAHLRGETPHYAVEYRLRHPSGTWHWYRQRGIALRDDHGRPYRMAGSMEDITDYKNAEIERARLEGQLLQAKKLEAMGTLAGGIAHDFNNILAAILGYGEMAQKDAPEGTALRRHIDAAVSAGMRAKSLVERILAFSRSGMGERVPVHVQSIVVEALDLVAASLPAGVRLERELAAGDAAVMGDPAQVHQVVMNLCTNAVHAMKSKGTLTVSLDLVEKGGSIVATSVLSSGNYVRLRVGDTGTGIPAHVLERVFDPFFTTKEIGVGTGLGLSLVHGIVTDLGGGVEVESRVGEGSTFTVYLPWQSSVVRPTSVEEPVANGAGETVLLVDDEEPLVRLGEEMIAELGYEPIGFTSSTAALETFRASPERFDAVLSDEAMPDMTGSELAKALRTIRPDIPIVLMSGYVTAQLSARAREAGVSDVLAKPLVSRDIARSLANALRH